MIVESQKLYKVVYEYVDDKNNPFAWYVLEYDGEGRLLRVLSRVGPIRTGTDYIYRSEETNLVKMGTRNGFNLDFQPIHFFEKICYNNPSIWPKPTEQTNNLSKDKFIDASP